MRPELFESEDFRGLANECVLCEGARVLLTRNIWVEAGLMNGALGYLRGYMWPEGGDPGRKESHLRQPVCVFVEFDSVNMGSDQQGRQRSFFPDDPPAHVKGSRRNWIPIFTHKVFCALEENLARENYPLVLAWALTHWKAQGMTLDRVRVHLSAKTAATPGIGLVACTRVRHPWDIVFEEDLPEYEHFMAMRSRRPSVNGDASSCGRRLARPAPCGVMGTVRLTFGRMQSALLLRSSFVVCKLPQLSNGSE